MLFVPVVVIVLARLFTHSDWAAANAGIAALLFAWVVADTLGLAALSKAPRDPRALRSLLGSLTLASVVILAGASAVVRKELLAMDLLLAGMVASAAAWTGWSAAIVIRALRSGAGMEASFSAILPPGLVRLVGRETAAMRLALFRWRLVPAVPEGTSAHRYDRYLAPMLWAFLCLQAIELVVVHLLLVHWNPTVAWIAFALSLAGILWFVALIKSVRLYPVLVEPGAVRVRGGLVIDLSIPFDAIDDVGEGFDAGLLKDRATVNCAILSEPNVTITLSRPVSMATMTGAARPVERVALRLDDDAAFRRALDRALGDGAVAQGG